jgi:hypothetical protein
MGNKSSKDERLDVWDKSITKTKSQNLKSTQKANARVIARYNSLVADIRDRAFMLDGERIVTVSPSC